MLLFCFSRASAYGVLTHEAIIDASWDNAIVPLLKKKFPASTPEEIIKAHAYAYGGAILPDMGYFPFGDIFFTQLVHYVRSGDFVMNLLSEARDLDEFAFALGALAHYNADKVGHPGAVNLSVSRVYPAEQKQFGDTVSFAEDPVAHRRMEFSFDVLQVARGEYASKSYHDFIGFELAQPLLEHAFLMTYGIELKVVCTDLPLAINTFRWSVNTFIPQLTYAAWISGKKEIKREQPGITRRHFSYGISKANYLKEWGEKYHEPGFGAYAEALVIRVFPKIGLARILKFKPPTQSAEALFITSFDRTVFEYALMLAKIANGPLTLENINFDTGKKTMPCEYALVDETYKELLMRLPLQASGLVDVQLRKNILDFYLRVPPNSSNEKEARECTDALSWLEAEK
ncbi:MAG: zinc dependent phospholipase C family protein [Bacteroidota bacterium]